MLSCTESRTSYQLAIYIARYACMQLGYIKTTAWFAYNYMRIAIQILSCVQILYTVDAHGYQVSFAFCYRILCHWEYNQGVSLSYRITLYFVQLQHTASQLASNFKHYVVGHIFVYREERTQSMQYHQYILLFSLLIYSLFM